MQRKFKPGQILVASYGGVSLLGTFLLMLPIASTQPGTTSFINAWFTAMSALTVTGLTVVNTATHWTLFGQGVILLLIQVGGLGLMVLTTVFLVFMGLKVGLGYRVLTAQDRNYYDFTGIIGLVRNIVFLTLVLEGIGCLFLGLFLPGVWEQGVMRGIFFIVFHAVSAFNGAGFDLTGLSLLPYRNYLAVNMVFMALILLGSLGYVVLHELLNIRRFRGRASLHCRLVLWVTGLMTLLGSIFYLLTEFSRSLMGLPLGHKIVESLFQAVTRTAGFTTVPVFVWNEPFLVIMILMMFVGASPGSVGGGIKTTTFGTIVLAVWALARGKKTVVIFEREISADSVFKAFAVTVIALIILFLSTLTLMLVEGLSFMPVVFEVASALATVGLTMGVTEQLSSFGLILISILMFVGRIGVLSLFIFLTKEEQRRFRYMKEDILIG
jgi:trk system potassium uptake protein TrkH